MSAPERPWENKPKPEPTAKEKKRDLNRWGLKLAISGVIVLGVIWWANYDPDDSGGRSGGPGSAQMACEEKVKAQLKAPGSAEFSDVNAVSDGEQDWTITGSVDAENSFGASLRHSFRCELTATTDETYSGTASVSQGG